MRGMTPQWPPKGVRHPGPESALPVPWATRHNGGPRPQRGAAMAVLAGRVAVVTGASVGIGAGLAAMLAAEGATVVLAARRERELVGVADGIRQRGGVA